MSEYSFNLNTNLYKYTQSLYITEPTGEKQTFIPLKLNLNSINFNFDTARPDGLDFRLAERSNGSGVFQMWVAYWDYTTRKATLWFKIPELLAGETKTLYAYWGYEQDTGVSDLRYLLGESVEGGIVYTDNLALGVSTSGSSPGVSYPDRAFDGTINVSSPSSCAVIPINDWLQCNFLEPTKINKIRTFGTDFATAPYGLEIRASNDDFTSEDVLIVDISYAIGLLEDVSFYFSNNNYYTHYRIIHDTTTWSWFCPELEMFGINEAEQTSTPVFLFGDDFEGTGLDVNKWTSNAGSWSISNSKINLGTDAWIRTYTGAISTDSPVNWIVEEGIVGIGSPTSTSVAAHRYRFYGGENVLGINYFWEGATDRSHDFVEDGTYVNYGGVNRGLIVDSYAQNYIAYYESTDHVYQGMQNRGGDQTPVYSENLVSEFDRATASDYLANNPGWGPGHATDGDLNTWWLTGYYVDPWWQYEFESAKVVKRLILTDVSMNGGGGVREFWLKASNDTVNWDLIFYNPDPVPGSDDVYQLDLDNSAPYLYWRIIILSGGGGAATKIADVEMYEILYYSAEFDYDDSWERKVNRNTEVTNFRIYGEDQSSANGVAIDWVIVRGFDPDSDPIVNYTDLWVEHEYVGHQLADYNEYQSDATSVNFHHTSDMGGDPYRMSDDITNSLTNIFISDEEVTEGNLVIDFGRTRHTATDNDYLYFNDDNTVIYYNAVKLSDLDTDVHGRNYWQTTTTSGWAAIQFPSIKDIACLSLTAVPGSTSRMVNNFKFYGSNSDPRFSGWYDKVLVYEGSARAAEEEQVFYFNTGLTFYEYYILEVLDTHGGNIAIQEWGMYERNQTLGKKIISQLRLHPVAFDSNEYFFAKEIELHGSNDGFNWTLLIPTTDTPTPFTDYAYGRWSRYTFENSNGYYMYKLTCYDNWRAATDQIKIAEWEMVERIEELDSVRILGGSTNNISNIWADPTTTINNGTMYMTNDVFNTIEKEKLIQSAIIASVDDFNVRL